jgi:hypothetical protein
MVAVPVVPSITECNKKKTAGEHLHFPNEFHLDEVGFCLSGCFSKNKYLGRHRTQHHNGWWRPERTG